MELLERRIHNGPALLPSFFLVYSVTYLRHEAPHPVRRLRLLAGGCVGAGAEGEARVEVARHDGEGPHVCFALSHCSCGQPRLPPKPPPGPPMCPMPPPIIWLVTLPVSVPLTMRVPPV